jgi:hypothetical protein
VYTLKKSLVKENRTFGDKFRGKIGFLGDEKETQGWEEKSSFFLPMAQSK